MRPNLGEMVIKGSLVTLEQEIERIVVNCVESIFIRSAFFLLYYYQGCP